MKRHLLISFLSIVILCSFVACSNNAMSEDYETDDIGLAEALFAKTITETTSETLMCEICGNIFDFRSDDWYSVRRYGRCCSCYSFYNQVYEEQAEYIEQRAEQEGYVEAPYAPGNEDVFAFFINDHTVQFVNLGDSVWSFDDDGCLLIALGHKYWYVEPVEDSDADTASYELEPGDSIYIDCDLSVYGELIPEEYIMVYGNMEDGSDYYSASFSVRDGEIILYRFRYVDYPELDRLQVIHNSFLDLQGTETYINANNNRRIELVRDLLDELATDGFYSDDEPLYRPDYPFPIIDADSIELVDNDEEISFYFETIDGYSSYIEIWSSGQQ